MENSLEPVGQTGPVSKVGEDTTTPASGYPPRDEKVVPPGPETSIVRGAPVQLGLWENTQRFVSIRKPTESPLGTHEASCPTTNPDV